LATNEIRSAPYHAARDFVVNGDEQFLLKQTTLILVSLSMSKE